MWCETSLLDLARINEKSTLVLPARAAKPVIQAVGRRPKLSAGGAMTVSRLIEDEVPGP